MRDNIFSPSFGNKPGTLVGRDLDIRKLTEGLHSNPGNKERARLIIGQRGLGKTVLLLELAEYARQHQYIVGLAPGRPICCGTTPPLPPSAQARPAELYISGGDRKSTRLNSSHSV